MIKKIIAAALALALVFSGCVMRPEQTSQPTPSPAPSVQPMPEASPEPVPEATPEPTPEVSPEPTPEATPEPTPEPTPDPTPVPDARELELTVHNGEGTYADSALTDGNNYTVRWIQGQTKLIFKTSEPMSALYIRWDSMPGEYELCWDGGSISCGGEGFLHEYIVLPEAVSKVWVEVPYGIYYIITDARAFTEGNPPGDVQVWSWNSGYADILAMPTHADDELLFFGPVLAYYINQLGLEVQVAYMTHHWYEQPRPHELLDGLWTLGVRSYPIISQWADMRAADVVEANWKYKADDVIGWQTELIRRFKPMVIIGHDIGGEYGHGVHQLNTDCLMKAVEAAHDPDRYPESAQEYGLWNTPKFYLHLYEQGQIVFPVDEPMSNADGATPYEIASAAYDCHESQKQWYARILRDENHDYDCRLFGLYRSIVGPDTGWDLWENIPER